MDTTERDTRSAAVTSAVRRETSMLFWVEATRDGAWPPAVATLSSRLGASRHPMDARPMANRRLADRRDGMRCLDWGLEQLRRIRHRAEVKALWRSRRTGLAVVLPDQQGTDVVRRPTAQPDLHHGAYQHP